MGVVIIYFDPVNRKQNAEKNRSVKFERMIPAWTTQKEN